MPGKVSVHILYRIYTGTLDPQLKRNDLFALATMGTYADENGWVGYDENGRYMADPRNIAKKVGAGASSISRSFAVLEKAGYVEWQRAWSAEKRAPIHGAIGRVRILLSDTPQA